MPGFGTYLRRLWDQKPQAYGPFSYVQSSLFHNAERIGIDPSSIVMACPTWEQVGCVLYDYGIKNTQFPITNPNWVNGGLDCLTNDGAVDIENTYIASLDSCLNGCNPFTVIFETQKQTTTNYFLILRQNSSIELHIVFVNGDTFRFKGKSTNWNNFDLSATYNTGDKFHAGLIADGTGRCDVFLDGKQVEWDLEGLHIPTDWITFESFEAGRQKLLSGEFTSLQQSFNNQAVICDVAVHPDVMASLHDNPYQLWQRVPRKTIFLPLGDSPILPIKLTPEILNTTSSTDIKADILRNLDVVISNLTSTTDISYIITRLLNVLVENGTSTPNISPVILRSLAVAIQSTTSTSGINIKVLRSIIANVLNTTSTTDIGILLEAIIQLQVAISNTTSTTTISHSMVRVISAMIENITSTSSISVGLLRKLLIDIQNSTSTTDISIILSNLKRLVVAISNTTSTTDIGISIRRKLISNVLNLTTTSAISILKKIALDVEIQNITNTEAISNTILRSLNVEIRNTTLTSDDVLIILTSLAIVGCDKLAVTVLQDVLSCLVSQDDLSCIVNCDKDT